MITIIVTQHTHFFLAISASDENFSNIPALDQSITRTLSRLGEWSMRLLQYFCWENDSFVEAAGGF